MPDQQNIIGKDTTIEGTVRCSGDVHISGNINGDVNVKGRATVLPGGVVDGEVASKDAEVAGKVKGSVTVEGRLVLKTGAVVDGDIKTGTLIIEEGARFNGGCQMGDNRSSRPEPPASATRGNGKEQAERTLMTEPPKKVPAGASA